jgi:pyruvate/2-oxoglutarate/acetoin dehydrogenase E1 component
MTRAAVASNDPVILYESRVLYLEKGPVNLDAPVESIGGARVLREGADVALVSWGRMVGECLRAADQLEVKGISASVVDLRWLNPLDLETVTAEVKRTTRLVVVHEANTTGGFGAEIVARVTEQCFFDLDQPPRRVALPDIRVPAAPSLQTDLVPTASAIARAASEVVAA